MEQAQKRKEQQRADDVLFCKTHFGPEETEELV